MTAQQNKPLWYSGAGSRVPPRLEPVPFAALPGFEQDDHGAAWAALSRSYRSIARCAEVLRPAVPPGAALMALAGRLDALGAPSSAAQAKTLFETHFQPFAIRGSQPLDGIDDAFLTGYYEPLVEGSLVANPEFTAPILARPDDLVSFPPGEQPFPAEPELSAARRQPGSALAPYPDRAAIEAGAVAGHTRPVVWLRDPIEVFMIQVQGSAKVRLPDGRWLRLTYAGRNGLPYSSIGRILVEEGHVAGADMSLAALKNWIRAHGQQPGEAGRALMQKNRSYVFFEAQQCADAEEGPIGGAGVVLSPLRSIAVDREIWSYGLPFWIDAAIPWQKDAISPFRRLLIAQDTGSAIVGAARADLYFGSGEAAGVLAAGIRHSARLHVLLPKASGGGK